MAGQENGFFFFFFLYKTYSLFFLWFFVVFFPQIKFVTMVEIPFKSGLDRTDSKRQPRHHPPAQHRLLQPFWDRAACCGRTGPTRAGAGQGAGVTIEGCRRLQERLWGGQWRGIEGKGPKQADAAGHAWDALGRRHRMLLDERGRTVRPKLGGRGLGAMGQAEIMLVSVHLGGGFPLEDPKPLLNHNRSKRGIKGQG